jgi:hypothetical protein
MLNRVLPKVLVDDTIDLKKNDYLKLKIEPTGELLLSSYGNNLDASLPAKLTVYVSKKVIGLRLKNKEPVTFKLRVDLNTKLNLDEQWNLNTACRIQKIHWITEPKTKIAGLKVNLKKVVSKQLESNESLIEEVICTALGELVPIKKQVSKIWQILNEPHRVAKNPVDIWLSTAPENFMAQFDQSVKDTVRVMIRTDTKIYITPLDGVRGRREPLPKNTSNQSASYERGLDLHVNVHVPYDHVNQIIEDQLKDIRFSYQGLSIEFGNITSGTEDERIELEMEVIGDFNATVYAYTHPVLDDEKNLLLTNINYKIESDNTLINLADWVANPSLTEFIIQKSKIPLSKILDSLDYKVMKALNKSNLSDKIKLDLSFSRLYSDTLIYSQDYFEWMINVEGDAYGYLTSEVVQ